jgi:hypothetical protein
MIDLGGIEPSIPRRRPAQTCSRGRYEQLSIPQGTKVEVVGCVRNGAIDRCATPLAGLLAVGSVDGYRKNRARHAAKLFRYALLLGLVLLVLSAGFLVDARGSLRVVRPGREP